MTYSILKNCDSVSICKDCNQSLESFIDIYTDDYDTPSPFRTIDDAYFFAEIIVKMLTIVSDDVPTIRGDRV